ncbi:MAG: creatininase family protein [Verrucomicrobia bacterium]|nr:MAG: creatininase family protein [Verrucomicrobiota bacterium]
MHPVYPPYRSRYLPAMTRDEIEMLPGKHAAVVILPIGAIEQHGPHLPVGTDSVLAQAWLDAIMNDLPARIPAYVAPTMAYGKSNEHQGFPGTLSLSTATLRRTLLAAADQLLNWGFRTMAVLNTHGGNSSVIVSTLREIQTMHGMNAGMLRPPMTCSESARENTYGFHAGEVETSLMLAIAPERVEMGKAVTEYPARIGDPGEVRLAGAPATHSWMTSDLSKSGVMGDAKAATPEKGRKWLKEGSRELAEQIIRLSNEVARRGN